MATINTPMDTYICSTFKIAFTRSDHLARHKKKTCSIPFVCEVCNRNFYTEANYKNHTETTHVLLAYICPICNKGFSRKDNTKRHEEKCNHQASSKGSSTKYHQASSSGAGTKRPLTRKNDNMVLDKRAKSNPFTIDVVSSALQDSV